MPDPTSLSRDLLDLLNQQRGEAERLKQQHDRDLDLQQQQWQKDEAWRRQQQQSQQRALQVNQQQHRQTFKLFTKNASDLNAALTLLKQRQVMGGMLREPEWKKFSEAERRLLEKISRSSGTVAEAQQALHLFHRRQAQQQQQQHQQQRLGASHQQEQLRQALRSTLRSETLGLRRRHGEERFKAREGERQKREQQRAARAQARASQQRKDARSAQFTNALYATATTLHAGAAVANIAQHPFLSRSQRIEKVGAVLPIIGPVLSGLFEFKNALMGVTAEMMKLSFQSRQTSLIAGQIGQRLQIEHGYGFAGVQAAARSGALRGSLPMVGALGQALVEKAAGRGTYQGERAYQFAAIRYGPQVQKKRAEAEVVAARRAADYATKLIEGGLPGRLGSREEVMLDRISVKHAKQATKLAYERDEARGVFDRGFWRGQGQKEIGAALLNEQKAQEQALANIRQLEEDIKRQQQARVTLAEKEQQLAIAKVNVLKSQAEILRQKEMTMGHAAQSLGTMNPAQRAMALAGLKMAMKSKDLGTLPPFLRGLAQQVAPGMMAKLAEQSGLKTKEYTELQRLGAVDKGDLGEVRTKQAEIQAKVDINLTFSEAAFAEKVAKAISASMQDLLKTIETKFTIELEALRRGLQQRNVNP